MIHASSPLARALVAFAATALAASLAGCSSSGTASSTTAAPTATGSPAVTSSVGAVAPTITAGAGFCAMATAATASTKAMTAATDDLSTAMSDPAAISGGDLSALRKAGQAILDNSAVSAAYFAEGTKIADDQATKDAFSGLSDFVSKYEVPLARAGLDSASYGEFATRILAVVGDSTVTSLADKATAWGATAKAFTSTKCGN